MLVSYPPSCYLSTWIQHVCWRICVRSRKVYPLASAGLCEWLQVHICHLTEFFAMMILTSFHSADPSTPTGVRCGKCLWVIHRPAIWASWIQHVCGEFVCVLERFSLRLQVFAEWLQVHHLTEFFAMMILTSFHSADPSTPTGVRCGKCLWVIHVLLSEHHESTCLLENLCAFSKGLACVCSLLWMVASASSWLSFLSWWCTCKFPFGKDPSTPTGVNVWKMLVSYPTVMLDHELMNTCLVENLCAFSTRFTPLRVLGSLPNGNL